jgi:hypothetical protein
VEKSRLRNWRYTAGKPDFSLLETTNALFVPIAQSYSPTISIPCGSFRGVR